MATAFFIFGFIILLIFIVMSSFFISAKKVYFWFEENVSIEETHWSYLVLGLGVFFIVITPMLPFFFVEFEEAVNGSMATVLWGLQFWQSYFAIGLLVVGLAIRKSTVNRSTYLFSGLILVITFFIVHMLLWPIVDTTTPLWGVPVPIHSISLLTPFAAIPFLGIGCLLIGATFSRTTNFHQLSIPEFFKVILPGITIGILGCLFFLFFWVSIILFFYLTYFL